MAHILVVDDDPDILSILTLSLRAMGHEVERAESGQEALTLAGINPPDLILMDLMMPEMDGYQATRLLKANEATAGIPVVAVTAKAMRGDEEEGRRAGLDGYITKPFRISQVLEVIQGYLGS